MDSSTHWLSAALRRRSSAKARWAWAFVLLGAAWSFFCAPQRAAAATRTAAPAERTTLDSPEDPAGVDAPAVDLSVGSLLDVDPLAVTDAMQAFLEEKVPSGGARLGRLLDLKHALFDAENGLGVTYGSSVTRTAAKTFEHASGNCLSFTLLFVALAQELNLNAFFVEVDEVTGWSQRGGVGLSHWHMYVEVELDNAVEQVDFLPWSDRRYFSARRISETRARAHYFSNVGAEILSTDLPGVDSVGGAIAHFEKALELDAGFVPAKINLAVAHRRAGAFDRAAALLLEVIEVEPNNDVAATNLAGVYLAAGRREDAKVWLARRARFLEQNPFHHFRLGLAALKSGDPLSARDHFKRAIDRQPNEAAFHEQLATSYERLGQPRKARTSLKRALRFAETHERQEAIEQRLVRHLAGP